MLTTRNMHGGQQQPSLQRRLCDQEPLNKGYVNYASRESFEKIAVIAELLRIKNGR